MVCLFLISYFFGTSWKTTCNMVPFVTFVHICKVIAVIAWNLHTDRMKLCKSVHAFADRLSCVGQLVASCLCLFKRRQSFKQSANQSVHQSSQSINQSISPSFNQINPSKR